MATSTAHAVHYGDHVFVLSFRGDAEPLDPDPHLVETCETAAEAVQRTFERLEERARGIRLHNREERRVRRLSPHKLVGGRRPGMILDYNAPLDQELKLMHERLRLEIRDITHTMGPGGALIPVGEI